MAKSQQTFNKSEKEKKRLKKREEKQKKREERKANSKKGEGFEEMFAYVDENGQISDTPPDLTKKKVEIKAENIEIGVPKRIIVMDISRNENKKEPMYFVNPVIKNKNIQKSIYEEGCLSVPDQFAEITRSKKIQIEYLDYYGEKKILNAEGLLATCIQHEMDHLEGILFIDYLSKLKKSMIIKKLSKQKIRPERIVV